MLRSTRPPKRQALRTDTRSNSDGESQRRSAGASTRLQQEAATLLCEQIAAVFVWLFLKSDDLLPLLAEPIDAERDHVAGFEEFRLGLHAEADAGRRAGDDDIARLHGEILRAAPHDMAAVEDHGRSVTALALFTVDVEPHVEALRVLDLVLGNEPRTERAEGRAALAFGPLPGALDLKDALGHVVGEAVTSDDVERLVLAEVTRGAADDDAEFDFPIELGRVFRRHGVVVRPADAARRLVEDDRLLGDRHAGFGGVIRVIKSDGNEIADLADARADARLALHQRQLVGIELAQLGKALGRQRVA